MGWAVAMETPSQVRCGAHCVCLALPGTPVLVLAALAVQKEVPNTAIHRQELVQILCEEGQMDKAMDVLSDFESLLADNLDLSLLRASGFAFALRLPLYLRLAVLFHWLRSGISSFLSSYEHFIICTSKEKDREREKEKEKEKDKEREREVEMEAALYTNCLLLGLDASVLGQGGMPRSGLFRHSNPRMGENLLHFLLSALRGPAQSAKDFAGVWPIFDAGQSRDFRKIVQNLINELEAQGALPRSNSRVSSLATCCGQRFVELLWQLSAHALREVHKRSFPADVITNPLPASLTEIVAQSSNASALLTVTKARIAIERRRFLDGAAAAVRRQALWSSLAHDMTAEYRALCAEEAYLHQELEKLQEPRYQREGVIREGQNGAEGSFEAQKSLSVSKASQLWESLLGHTAQHEKLASGPIEDLIAHREHRYRVSGPALRAAMDRSSSVSSNELPSFAPEEEGAPHGTLKSNQTIFSYSSLNHARLDMAVNALDLNEESRSRIEERSAKGSSPIDVAEILRRWTHSLQRLHKQALRLARSNDGAGPDLIKETSDEGDNGHAQALRATLAEHKQHLANIQALIVQLKSSMPVIEASITSLREQVSRATPLMIPSVTSSPLAERLVLEREGYHAQRSEVLSKAGTSNVELVPQSASLKLPQIFSLSAATMGRSSQLPKARVFAHTARSLEAPAPDNGAEEASIIKVDLEGRKEDNLASLRQSVHDAALSVSRNSVDTSKPEKPEPGAEHFFTPIVTSKAEDEKTEPLRSSPEYHRFEENSLIENLTNGNEDHHHMDGLSGQQARVSKPASKCLSYNGLPKRGSSLLPVERQHTETPRESKGSRPFSPPLLTELSSFSDPYDDLLGAEDFELSDVALEGVWFNPGM
ncbi:hypothetical protein GOP47_0017422 [Adiantum capillus-veneris]|uniref:HAUS augmin-like complex subunit 6 N-terminal domain-containing protein n=1 Tax=Adiantum capillus-veneris TaxID=13818 RepID=A0A9D4Z9P2_ADICA|nr:hypothetical protein GOP47_0017422 [Adiantum capillus-veneris]